MIYLVTGAAGFIGASVVERLCRHGHHVVGVDSMNDYYDRQLKLARLTRLEECEGFEFLQLDLSERDSVAQLFQQAEFDRVIHLAAQAGVRYSIENPMAYIDSNLVGMATILEGCRHHGIEHLVYASSSSVYGMNESIPFSTKDNVDHPVSLYAATKKSNELMAHTYSHLYNLPTTGLRFFTVYGPWGRPDMAPFKFVQAIENGETIDVYNHGKMQRDFTYIDDIIEGVIRVQDELPQRKGNNAPYAVFNIGNSQPVELEKFIQCIESALGKKAIKNYLPMQPGDVVRTYADVSELEAKVGFKPTTQLQDGIDQFVKWYRDFYTPTITNAQLRKAG